MVPPVNKLLRVLFLLLITTQVILSCKTTENEAPVILTQKNESLQNEKRVNEEPVLPLKPLSGSFTGGTIEETQLNWLKEAEKAWFNKKDPEYTEYCLDQITPPLLMDENEISLYALLCRKVYSRVISWDNSFLDHRNISRLFLDQDDLWIGTWAGGIGRFSLPLEELTLIRGAKDSLLVETLYSFIRQGHIIRMAGYGPIYDYDRRTSQFSTTYPEGPERINGLELHRDKLLVSTVNNGIWVDQGNNNWQKVNLPEMESHINTLHGDRGGNLLIGTAKKGILVYDGFTVKNINTLYPDFKGINITSLYEKGDYLVVGTYGEGGYLINRRTGETEFFSQKKGNMSSDYVLCTSLNDSHAFWGTLGGGITAYSLKEDKSVSFIGMEEGLLSLDVSSLTLYEDYILIANLGQGLIMMREKIIEKKL